MSQSTQKLSALQRTPNEIQRIIGTCCDVASMKAFSLTSGKYRGMLHEYIFTQVKFEGTQAAMSSELGAYLGDSGNPPTMAATRNKVTRATFTIKPDNRAQPDNQLVDRIINSIEETQKLRVLVLDVADLAPGENPPAQEAQFRQAFANLPELDLKSLKLFAPETLPPIIISKCNPTLLKGLHVDDTFIRDLLVPLPHSNEVGAMIQSLQGLKKLYFDTLPDFSHNPGLSQVRTHLHTIRDNFFQVQWLGFYTAPTPTPYVYPDFYGCIGNINSLLRRLPNLKRFVITVYSANIEKIPETPNRPPTEAEEITFYEDLVSRVIKEVPWLEQLDILSESPVVWRGTRSKDRKDDAPGMKVQRLELPNEARRGAYPFGIHKDEK
ncbi:hypothetical protein B0J13DRAFT_657822 [Dactylonectria estremocensis]|uniref:Uncharacterized protein n=1 Tax=Dactylonectria estremocensis TaxID=1079267 RepID=A0A9P9F238_9HYPO|nr:hypothetical protein B0J13DRAFT_657822 [Dactylonectria estremocensis]